MGLISDAQAIKAVQRIKNGGKAKLSISQITNISVNMMDAKKNLPEIEFMEVYALYKTLRQKNTKVEMDLESYFDTVFSIIKEFDAIAPYEKYSGADEKDMSLLMEELRKTEQPTKQSEPKKPEFDRDILDLLDRDDIQCRDDICEAEYKKAMDLLKKPTNEKIHRAYDIMGNLAAQFQYVPAILWMADFQESVANNLKQAAYWYKTAAELGDGNGARCYADMLMTGRGVEQNMSLAMHYYADAADKGIPEAAFVLGEYFRNVGDIEHALKAYKQAYEGGYTPAKTRINQMKSK